MLSAAVSILSGLGLTAPDQDHGLPGLATGEPFGFQVAIKTAKDAQDFAFAEWIVLLPLIAAALCGLYAAFGIKNRLPGWTTVVALGASFVLAVMMVVKLDPTSGSPIVVHLFDWVDFSWGNGSTQESIRANFGAVPRWPELLLDPLRHVPRHPDRLLCHRVHGRRSGHGVLPILRRSQRLPLCNDVSRARRQPPDAVSGLGRGRPRELLAHWLLLPQARSRLRGQEGVRDEPHR